MRLLDTSTGQFHNIDNPTDEQYAILSHRWDRSEQSYQEVCVIQKSYPNPGSWAQTLRRYLGMFILCVSPQRIATIPTPAYSAPLYKLRERFVILAFHWISLILSIAHRWAYSSALTDDRLSRKIRDACAYASAEGHQYLWIDSCCIDKSSSAELSEAINAMYLWYQISVVCYAYLSDVHGNKLDHPQIFDSQWHTRGWTLQELLAPDEVVFLSATWTYLGTKITLAGVLQERLDIHPLVLMKSIPLHQICAAQVMSWGAVRETTRAEDGAYCLWGLFGVNMPTLYGEGGSRAFVRLQEEIWKSRRDPSILSWNHACIPKRVVDLDRCYASDDISEAMTEHTTRTGRPAIQRKVDYCSHFATHPADFLIGRDISTLTPQEFSKYLGFKADAPFGQSGWMTPTAQGAPSDVPCIPLDAIRSAKTAIKLSSSLSNLYLILLPCVWRQCDSDTTLPDGGLLAVAAMQLPSTMASATPDNVNSLKVLQSVVLHVRPSRSDMTLSSSRVVMPSSRMVVLTTEDLAGCSSHLQRGTLVFETSRSSLPRLARSPAVTHTMTSNAIDWKIQSILPSIQLACRTKMLLSAEGYTVTPLSSSPILAEPPSQSEQIVRFRGFRLEKTGSKSTLAILIQHGKPSYRGSELAMLLRIGLEVTTQSVATGNSPSYPQGSCRWSEWRLMEEGTTRAENLADPRDENNMFFFQTKLGYHSKSTTRVYALRLDVLEMEAGQRTP